MKNIDKIIQNEYNIELAPIDTDYLNKLNVNNVIQYNPNKGKFYTIVNGNGHKVGVIGYIGGKEDGSGFLQIIVDPKHRGKGVFKLALDKLIKQENLKKLYSTIHTSNLPSIKAHLKYGFRFIDETILQKLRELGLLDKDKTRMIY
jgi:RimJ/RimL family protein N-acetyltransferase